MRVWSCNFYNTEEWIVNQKQCSECVSTHETAQTQTIYVDGCKVTVRYSDHKNPDAIRGIKEILLTNIAKKV